MPGCAAPRPGRQRAAERRRPRERARARQGAAGEGAGALGVTAGRAAPHNLSPCRDPRPDRETALPRDSPLSLPLLRPPRNAVIGGKKGILLTVLAVGGRHSEMEMVLWSSH